jgi:hypothetical protein
MRKLSLLLLVVLVSCVPWNTAPECKFITPENGSEYQRGEDIEVYVKITDDGSIDEVRIYLDGIGIASIIEFPYSYTLETAELEVGVHSLKAEVTDNLGKEDDSDVSFTITTGLPIVETLQPVYISEGTAVAGGTVIDDGGGTISSTGIVWSTVPYDVSGRQEQSAELSDDIFSTNLTNLDSAIYYVSAFVENEAGRSFGEEISFNAWNPE